MKVLMLAPGTSIHSQRPLNWLLERGCKVVFVNRRDSRPGRHDNYVFVPYLGGKGFEYVKKLAGSRIARQWRLWTATLQLRLLHRYFEPDIVHVHWLNLYAYYCVKAGLKPLVLSVWGSDVNFHFLPGAHPDYRQAVGQALANADLVIVDAPNMADKCALLAGREIRTELLSIGVDTRVFRPGHRAAAIERRRQLNIPQDAAVLLSIRAWQPHYGHHDILEAFALAHPRLKTNSFLVFKVFQSESATYEAEVRRRAQELGIASSVRWMGQVDFAAMPRLYAFADIIINYPSIDAFPITFLEAAACQRPVVTCRLPAYLGTFAEKYFQMVQPGKVADLADALVEVINAEPDQRTNRLAEARRVVEQRYDESVSARRLLNIYRELVTATTLARIPTSARKTL